MLERSFGAVNDDGYQIRTVDVGMCELCKKEGSMKEGRTVGQWDFGCY